MTWFEYFLVLFVFVHRNVALDRVQESWLRLEAYTNGSIQQFVRTAMEVKTKALHLDGFSFQCGYDIDRTLAALSSMEVEAVRSK